MELLSNLSTSSLVAIAFFAWFAYVILSSPELLTPEPPILTPRIPYIGHIIGLLRHGINYYQITGAKCKLSIYTLPMLNGKVYIVTAPELVSAVNRSSRTLAFNPFISEVGKRMTGHDEATSKVVQHNLNGENGTGYVIDIHDGHIAALSPGQNLETMVDPVLNAMATHLSDLKNNSKVELFSWLRKMTTMCSTRAIYGPSNPFDKDSRCHDFFWDFDNDLNRLMVGVLPSVLAPKGARGRAMLGSAFENYFNNFDPNSSQISAMVKSRYVTNTKYGISTWNQGRLEVGTLIGILANTIPSTFYMLVNIYSNPSLLQSIRAELETNSVSTTSPASKILHVLAVRDQSPLLLSTWNELLRLYARGASSRLVLEDTWLDNRYLLRKNMVVQMPTAVMHTDPKVWGPDAHVFNARRFMKSDDSNNSGKSSAGRSGAAYRPFGGGSALCPGRHFVTMEVMTLTAWLVLRFDMEPLENGGKWVVPEQKQESLATNVFPPGEDVRVRIVERKGYEGVEWGFEVD